MRLVASELTDDLAMFFTCGLFGWTGTPAALQVVTRAIVWELGQVLRGRIKMYTDDLIGICLRSDLQSEME